MYAHPIFLHPCAMTMNASQSDWEWFHRQISLINVMCNFTGTI